MKRSLFESYSTGGLGDSFIVSLKLNQIYNDNLKDKFEKYIHTFIESNEKSLELIKEFTKTDICPMRDIFEFNFEFDPNYQNNVIHGKWKDITCVNTSIRGDYHFPCIDNIYVRDEFSKLKLIEIQKDYDICIQCSAGVNSDRKWKFNPLILASTLRNKGLKVSLIGSDDIFFDKNDIDNFVNKTTLTESIKTIRRSNLYMGLSGFHTYWSLSSGIKNLHLEESDNHNHHYIHPSWNKDRYPIKTPAMGEVISLFRRLNINI